MLEATLDAHLAAGLTPSVQPFHAFMYDTLPIEKIRRLSEAYARRAEVAAAALRPPKFAHPAADAALATAGEGRLKVGYVSSGLWQPPVGAPDAVNLWVPRQVGLRCVLLRHTPLRRIGPPEED